MRRLLTLAALALAVAATATQADAAPSVRVAPVTPLFSATSGVFYSVTLAASGGAAPYGYSLVAGALPHGLSLSSDGIISGIPDDVPGLYTFGVQALDAKGAVGTTTLTFSLATPTILLSSVSIPAARAGESYRYGLSATGGSPGYVFSLAAGSLPAGLYLSSDGVFSGTPAAAGVWLFTVQIVDGRGIRGVQTFRFVVQKAKAAPKKIRLHWPP